LLGSQFDVQNFGRSGADVLSINNGPYANTSEHQAALAFAPNVVISNLGINDFSLFLDNQLAFVNDYVDLLRDYSDLPTSPDIYLWTELAPVFSANPNAATIDAQRVQVNQKLTEISAAVGATGINMYVPLVDQELLFPDGLHPDSAGAGIIAQTTAAIAFGDPANGIAGDVNQDGQVSTGSGNVTDDDVAAFLAGWRANTTGLSPLNRTMLGDLNLDGVTSIADSYILHRAVEAQGLSFVIGTSQAESVPEPAARSLFFLPLVALIAGISSQRSQRTGRAVSPSNP